MAIGSGGFLTWVRDFGPGVAVASIVGRWCSADEKSSGRIHELLDEVCFRRGWLWSLCYSRLCITVGRVA